jgi:lysophospholipase L1-like esterase
MPKQLTNNRVPIRPFENTAKMYSTKGYDRANLVGWYSADFAYAEANLTTLATADSSECLGLRDLSGNNNHLTGTANTGLILRTGANGIAGKSAMQGYGFDAANRRLTSGANMLDTILAGGFTMYAVCQNATFASSHLMVASIGSGTATSMEQASASDMSIRLKSVTSINGTGGTTFNSNFMPDRAYVYAFRVDAVNNTVRIFCDGYIRDAAYVGTAANAGKLTMLAQSDGNYAWNGMVRSLKIYKTVHSDAQMQAVIRDLQIANGLSDSRITFVGTSLTVGNGATAGQEYPTLFAATLFTASNGFSVRNMGVAGRTTSQMMYASDPKMHSQQWGPMKYKVAVIEAGTNDLATKVSVADTCSYIQTLCTQFKSYGSKVVVTSIAARKSGLTAPLSNEDFNTYRKAVNAWLSANYTKFADAYVDLFDVHPVFTDYNNCDSTTWFNADKIHFSNYTYQSWANEVQGVVSKLIAETPEYATI